MPETILKGLNPQQKEAVLHLDSPLLIVAGAGSGKTRVITHKIAYLIMTRSVHPANILGVTFTNKAADEMKIRIEALTNLTSQVFHISTFHALGLRILRESGHHLGFNNQWQVIDEEEQRRIINRILDNMDVQYTRDMKDDLRKKFNLAKMNIIYPNNSDRLKEQEFQEDEIDIFRLYHNHLETHKLWDYEDLISYAVLLLEHSEKIRKKYNLKYQYIVIDEFQDTNPNQYELIRLIARGNRNITVVGDDDQAIYSWRGASVHFLFAFESDFPGTRIIKLEHNYRSTRTIIDFANHLIANNIQRRQKEMLSRTDSGDPVWYLNTWSKEDEAEKIADFIEHLNKEKTTLFPLAILYRINAQSLPFETTFTKRGIDFQIIKGLRFFERREIKDAVALLRLAYNLEDDIAFHRIIDFLPLGIGKKTLDHLLTLADENNCSLFQSLRDFMSKKFQRTKIFYRIQELNKNWNQNSLSKTLKLLLKHTGYPEILKKRDEESRIMNIKELQEFLKKWEKENPEAEFVTLIDQMTVSTEKSAHQVKARVYLLTMHNAKGMEFPTVVVAGSNGIYMPFFLRKKQGEIEEERRLFYVAATRAAKLLILSTGSLRESPFLQAIRKDLYLKTYTVDSILERLKPSHRHTQEEAKQFIDHPVFGRGNIIESVGEDKYLVQFSEKEKKLIDTSVVKVKFL